MKIYNSLSRQKEDFVPLDPQGRRVGFYSCGITAYNYAHIGNLRRYVMDDVIVRTLRRFDYQVKFVQNVTDVGHLASDGDWGEDKLEAKAKASGEGILDLARYYEDYFYGASQKIGNALPDVICRATEHIEEQKQIVEALEKKGLTYEIKDDGIYFDTSKIDNYGFLGRLDKENLKSGARVEEVAGKRHPTDFALWKFERQGENRALVWPSKWGERTFPGWHTECVAMSIKYLGPQYDIHSGGIDHLTVHHPNEIAQAEAVTGKVPFVKYWVHHNFLLVDGQKMSKSLGNIYRLEDIEARGFSPMALRYLFLTAHYRSQMNFTWENLAGAQKAYDRLVATLVSFSQQESKSDMYNELLRRLNEQRDKFYGYLSDDFDTPRALVALGEAIKMAAPESEKFDLIMDFDEVLGLGLRQAVNLVRQKLTISSNAEGQIEEDLSKEVKELLDRREAMRDKGDFESSDQLRAELVKLGYEVIDEASGGQKLKKIN